MLSLLPPEQRIAIEQARAIFNSQIIDAHDAVLLMGSDDDPAKTLNALPDGAFWRALHKSTQTQGGASVLSARATTSKRPLLAIGFLKSNAQPFDRLTLAARLWKEIASCAPRRVLLAAPGIEHVQTASALECLLAAVLAGAAPMPSLKSKPLPVAPLKHVTLLHDGAKLEFDTVAATNAGNHVARWLSTLPPNYLDCVNYAKALRVLAKQQGWRMRFLGEPALRRLGAGAFLAVAQANAHRGAGIVRLSSRVSARKRAGRVALVGKGICFDTGGINLKTHKGMYHMHADMQGSAVAVGTMLALTQLDAPYDVDCWLALTENEIGPKAYRPQDIVTAANGISIQVAHSDAEGRMALADTLVFAARERPDVIIDFATLTGACVTALTERMSGVFSNRAAWRTTLEEAGRTSGERVWGFPMDEDYDTDLDSSVADVLQCTPDSKGDHILAARFLNRFVPADIPWIHLDLAAGHRSGGLAHIPTEHTGFGVRYATELLLRHGPKLWKK